MAETHLLMMDTPPEKATNQRAASRRLCSPPAEDGSMCFLRMHQLWDAAATLPVVKVQICRLPGIDDVRWFGGPLNLRPTCRAVAEHGRDIYDADLNYPIILSPDGEVLDGMHRICKALLLGLAEIDAVRLEVMPEPLWRVPSSGEKFGFLRRG